MGVNMTSQSLGTAENDDQPAMRKFSLLRVPEKSASRRPRVLYVTPEIGDYIKTGGLGEVAAALPRALKAQVDVRVLLPGYPSVLAAHPGLKIITRVQADGMLPACAVGEARTPDGLAMYIVIAPDLYARDGTPYQDASGNEWADNHVRFACFSRVAAQIAEGLPGLRWKPDLLHLNDWPCGLASGYLHWRGVRTPTIFTIHNLAYQGLFDPAELAGLALPPSAFDVHGLEFFGKASFLKAGLYYSSHLTTVSATYASEITTAQFGCGLHGLLRTRENEGRLSGILNGIDDHRTPQQAPHLVEAFDVNNWNGKQRNAQVVRSEFELSVSRGPLFAIVSRLVHQKGLDLALQSAETIIARGGQIVVTGRGEADVEDAWRLAARRHPGKIGVKIGFEDAQAQRIFTGSDFLLMPSRFEPCGLGQMYAQRMATLPVARRTGGLAETIQDGVTGFLFGAPTTEALLGAVDRAMNAFGAPSTFNAMRRAAMTQPFGWRESARKYAELYSLKLA